MAKYELSAAADSDLNEIYVYSYREFGEARADAYLLSLEKCFDQLAEFPDIGQAIDRLRAGYCRFAHASHTVYFVKIKDGIRIVRVLHQRMDPERHLRVCTHGSPGRAGHQF